MEREINQKKPIKLIILILLIIVTIIFFIPKHQKVKPTKESELIYLKFDNIVQNHILFSDIKIYKKEDSFYLSAKATNMTSNNLKITPINIILTDKNKKQTVLIGYIGDNLKSEDSQNILIQTNKNLKNIETIDINVQAQV